MVKVSAGTKESVPQNSIEQAATNKYLDSSADNERTLSGSLARCGYMKNSFKQAVVDRSLACFVACRSPSSAQIQTGLLFLGVALLSMGLSSRAEAYVPYAKYNDDRIAESVDVILTYINGTFGALVMVSAGIAAILSSAFGQYRAALGLLVVAVGSFILRSLVSTWFNDNSLQSQQGSL